MVHNVQILLKLLTIKLMKCQRPHCANNLPPNRTYECSECSSKILAAARYFFRPLSALIGEFDVTPNTHQNSIQEPDTSTKSSSRDDSIGS